MREEITRGTDTAPRDEAEAGAAFRAPHRYVDANGERVAAWRFGRGGPDVVFVHGWPLHAATFRRLVPALARDFTLHLFDLPGTGRSERRGPCTLGAHAQTVRAIVDALGLDAYGVVAHDSGGAIARMAVAGDARARAVVLGNTEIPGYHPPLVQAYIAATKVPGLAPLLLSAMRIGPIRRSRLGFGACFTDPRYVDGPFAEWFVRPILRSRDVARGQLALIAGLDVADLDALEGVHARIAAPVRCVWGAADPFFPIAKARAMLGQFAGGADLVEIPRAKLFAHEDHPEAFVAHAAPFLARHLGGGAHAGVDAGAQPEASAAAACSR